MALSDWHIGAMVDTQWNCYSVDIAKERMEQLLNKVKRYILNYNITNLVVEINGDMVHGLINVSNRVQSEEDVVSQIIIVSDMLSYFINELKPYVRNLKVVTTLGNHGRLIPNKKLEDSILRAIIAEDLIADEASQELATIRRKKKNTNKNKTSDK